MSTRVALRHHATLLLLVLSFTDVTLTLKLDDLRSAVEHWKNDRRSLCVGSAGKCLATGQCCDGLVCAAFDDYYAPLGQKLEAPGYCVKEKDLQACTGDGDCSGGNSCVSLGRGSVRYCLPKTDIRELLNEELTDVNLKGLGEPCGRSADCRQGVGAEKTQLCCQDIHKGRQGLKRQCDRVTAISKCIA